MTPIVFKHSLVPALYYASAFPPRHLPLSPIFSSGGISGIKIRALPQVFVGRWPLVPALHDKNGKAMPLPPSPRRLS